MAQLLVAIAIAWVSAQLILKPLLASIKAKRCVLEAIWWQGGMPSGHAALVGSLVAALAKIKGFWSPEVAIAMVFALMVIYDAVVTRTILMRQGEALSAVSKKKVEAIVGHRPMEVIAGLVVGAAVTWMFV